MQYKHSGTFANSKQGRTAFPQKMCDPILVTLLKMRPHCSQSSREMRSHPAAHPHYWPLRRKYPPRPSFNTIGSGWCLYLPPSRAQIFSWRELFASCRVCRRELSKYENKNK